MTTYTAPIGAPIWADLMSSDPAGAVDFYGQLFGWQPEAPPNPEYGGYQTFLNNGSPVAGLMPEMPDANVSNVWSVYLHTTDSAATVVAVEEAGGRIMVPPMKVGEEGTMMVAVDTAGAAIGFWEPGQHPGFAQWGEHGTPYWVECQSKDYAASTAFYSQVVGVRGQEVGTGGQGPGPDRYTQLFWGDLSYGGIMDSVGVTPDDAPSFWQLYVTVDDFDKALAQVADLGGTVLMSEADSPYGSLAALLDPQGALISIGKPPAGM